MREILGYVFLAFSLLAWAAIALLPFMDISKAQTVGATTFLIIAGELLFCREKGSEPFNSNILL